MSTLCFCKYSFVCSTEERAKEVYETLTKWLSVAHPQGVNWHGHWIGLLLLGSGVATWDGSNITPEYKCAGTAPKMPMLNGTAVTLDVEWKNDNHDEVVADSIGKVFPDVEILYNAMQENNEYLLTNDEDLVDKCIIDVWGHEEEEFWQLAQEQTGMSKEELEQELLWLANADWYMNCDLDSVSTLAEALLPEQVDNPTEVLNDVYSLYLKISQWEYEPVKKSSIFG